jgi:hypothetical protein
LKQQALGIQELKNMNGQKPSHFHGSILHNSPKMETLRVSINSQRDKQNVASAQNGALFSYKNECIIDI